MPDHLALLFPTFSFPLNVYAQALWLEYEQVPYLHYGFFSSPDESLHAAQQNSTEKLIELLPATPARLLEVGIGLGTTARRLQAEGFQYTGITPDNNQILYCQRKHREHSLEFVQQKFQNFSSAPDFDVILFQESAQYIEARELLSQSHSLLKSSGKVVILDEIPAQFMEGINPALQDLGFELDYEEDVTAIAAPSITLLCNVIDKHSEAVCRDLNLQHSKLQDLMSILRERESDYASGNYTYQVLRLTKI